MQLLRHMEQRFYACDFETSNFALTELTQVVRDSLLARKMELDAQSLSYFHQLKDYYQLTLDELGDAFAYLRQVRDLLTRLRVSVTRMSVASQRSEQSIEDLCFTKGVDTSDAMHIAWAYKRKCKYLATTDRRLLDRAKEIPLGGVWIVDPNTLTSKPELRRTP